MSYYPEPHSHITDKVELVLLDLWKYAIKKELDHAAGVNTSDVAAKNRPHCFESWNWQTRH